MNAGNAKAKLDPAAISERTERGVGRVFEQLRKWIFTGEGEQVASSGPKAHQQQISVQDLTDVITQHGEQCWRTCGTPEQIIELNRQQCSQSSNIRISSTNGEKEVLHGIRIFGDFSAEDLFVIKRVISRLSLVTVPVLASIREIHILSNLGTFVTQGLTSQTAIQAFTLNSQGALLISKAACLNEERFSKTFGAVLDEHESFLRESRLVEQAEWTDLEAFKRGLSRSRLYTGADAQAPYGRYRNRPVIEKDAVISNGVYVQLKKRGAVVADAKAPVIDGIFKELLERIKHIRSSGFSIGEQTILEEVSKLVNEQIQSNSASAVKTLLEVSRISFDEEVNLSLLIKARIGASVHKALLAGILLERLKEEHEIYLNARISIERNTFQGEECHWIRYTGLHAGILILDPESQYVGLLGDYSKSRWAYLRPEDLNRPKRVKAL